jgi:hypothetical protein
MEGPAISSGARYHAVHTPGVMGHRLFNAWRLLSVGVLDIKRRRRPPGAQAAQLVLEHIERLLHALLGIEQYFFGCHGVFPQAPS